MFTVLHRRPSQTQPMNVWKNSMQAWTKWNELNGLPILCLLFTKRASMQQPFIEQEMGTFYWRMLYIDFKCLLVLIWARITMLTSLVFPGLHWICYFLIHKFLLANYLFFMCLDSNSSITNISSFHWLSPHKVSHSLLSSTLVLGDILVRQFTTVTVLSKSCTWAVVSHHFTHVSNMATSSASSATSSSVPRVIFCCGIPVVKKWILQAVST